MKASHTSPGCRLVRVNLGPSLVRELDREAGARGGSRSAEVVRWATIGLGLQVPPPPEGEGVVEKKWTGRGQDEAWSQGNVTLHVREEFYESILRRTALTNESVSAAFRVLLYAGLLSRTGYRPKDPYKRALAILKKRGTLGPAELAKAMWPVNPPGRGNGAGKAGVLLKQLVLKGLAVQDEPAIFRPA